MNSKLLLKADVSVLPTDIIQTFIDNYVRYHNEMVKGMWRPIEVKVT